VAALGLGLAGCSSLGLPMGDRLDRTAVGSIRSATPVSATRTPPVAASDWETIRQSIPAALAKSGVSDWTNEATGSSGTLTLAQSGKDGCRGFSTTVSDVRGIRHYRGDACRNAAGAWSIGDLTADDAILS
jgi:hypothetical protein